MIVRDGGSAFPVAREHYADGMSLRDYFAAKALQAMMSNSDAMDAAAEGCYDEEVIMSRLADRAYATADAMIAARGDL